MENRRVKIKRIENLDGLAKGPDGKALIKYPRCKDVLTCPMSRETGNYKINLNAEERAVLEEALNENLNPSSTNPFWHEFNIVFTDKSEKILDLNDPSHYLQYKVLLAHEKVANSVKEKEAWPKAKFIIYDEDEEAKVINTKARIKGQAYVILSKLSMTDKRDYLMLLGYKASNMSDELVDAKLNAVVEESPIKLVELNARDSKFKNVEVNIHKLVEKNVLSKKGTAYLFNETLIGSTLEHAINYLLDGNNQTLYRELLQTLEERKPKK